jgi:hypothetical protein
MSPNVKIPDANVVTLGIVMPALADAGLNLNDKGK